MKLHLTHPPREKNQARKPMRPQKKYPASRIRETLQKENSALLSKKYGVMRPQEEVPFHDDMVRERPLPDILKELKHFFSSREIDEVVFHTGENPEEYTRVVKAACESLGIKYTETTSL